MANAIVKISKRAKQISRANKNKAWKDCIAQASREYKAANKPKRKIAALPIGFTGNFLGYRFKVINQYNIDGTVTAQLWEIDPPGNIIAELNGRKTDADKAANVLTVNSKRTWARNGGNSLSTKDERDFNKRVQSFTSGLNKEVLQYNTGVDTKTTRGKDKVIKYSNTVKSKSFIDQIKTLLTENKRRMKYGYKTVPGKVRAKKTASISGAKSMLVNWHKDMLQKALLKKELATTKREKRQWSQKAAHLKKELKKFTTK